MKKLLVILSLLPLSCLGQITNGLLCRLTFDQTYWTNAQYITDISGNSAHAWTGWSTNYTTNAPNQFLSSLITGRPYQFTNNWHSHYDWASNGYALYLRGGQFAAITNTANLTNRNTETINVWAYFDAQIYGQALDHTATILDGGYSQIGGWSLGRNSENGVSFQVVTNVGSMDFLRFNDPTDPVSGKTSGWHMYTVTWSNGTASVYLDCVLQSSRKVLVATNLLVCNNTPIKWIGVGVQTHNGTPSMDDSDGYPNNGWMHGGIDEVQFFNRVLTADEIVTLFQEQAGQFGSPASLVTGLQAWFKFSDPFTNTFYLLDYSGNNRNGIHYGRIGSTTNWPSQILPTNFTKLGPVGEFHQYFDSTPETGKSGDYAAITNLAGISSMVQMTASLWARYYPAASNIIGNDHNATFLNSGYAQLGAWKFGREYSTSFGETDVVISTNNSTGQVKIAFPENYGTFGSGHATNGDSGTFHHYAFTVDCSSGSAIVKCYFQGTNFSTTVIPGVPALTVKTPTSGAASNQFPWIAVGCQTHNGTAPMYDGDNYPNHGWLNGCMDDIRIYNRVLSDSEVLSLFANTNDFHYLDVAATGTGDGSTWTNAWQSASAINWNTISPGDYLLVAHGDYTSTKLTFGVNGVTNFPVTVLAAQDPLHAGVATFGYDTGISMSRNWVGLNGGLNQLFPTTNLYHNNLFSITNNTGFRITSTNGAAIINSAGVGAKILWCEVFNAGGGTNQVSPQNKHAVAFNGTDPGPVQISYNWFHDNVCGDTVNISQNLTQPPGDIQIWFNVITDVGDDFIQGPGGMDIGYNFIHYKTQWGTYQDTDLLQAWGGGGESTNHVDRSYGNIAFHHNDCGDALDGRLGPTAYYGSMSYFQISGLMLTNVYIYDNIFVDYQVPYNFNSGAAPFVFNADGFYDQFNPVTFSNLVVANNLFCHPQHQAMQWAYGGEGAATTNNDWRLGSGSGTYHGGRGFCPSITFTNSYFCNNLAVDCYTNHPGLAVFGFAATNVYSYTFPGGSNVYTGVVYGSTNVTQQGIYGYNSIAFSNNIVAGVDMAIKFGPYSGYATPELMDAAWGPRGNVSTRPTFTGYQGQLTPGYTNWDFHLAPSDTAARGKGVNLSALTNLVADINRDMDGNLRSASGSWDIGPFAGTQDIVITNQPSSVSVGVGDSVTFRVGASGGSTLHYQWYRSGNAIGSDSSATTWINSQLADSGSTFYVQITDTLSSLQSQTAVLTVTNAGPDINITVQPQDISVAVGQSATFNVSATGGSPLHYAWTFDGNPVGSDSPTYVRPNCLLADNGLIARVTVADLSGSVLSNPSTLTVTNPAPTVTGVGVFLYGDKLIKSVGNQ